MSKTANKIAKIENYLRNVNYFIQYFELNAGKLEIYVANTVKIVDILYEVQENLPGVHEKIREYEAELEKVKDKLKELREKLATLRNEKQKGEELLETCRR